MKIVVSGVPDSLDLTLASATGLNPRYRREKHLCLGVSY